MQQEALDQPHRRSSSPTPILRWSPPGIGGFKLNVDGALDMRSGCRGVGTVVRDGYGNMVCIFAMNAPSLISVLATESYAMKVGCECAVGAGWLPLT